MYGKFNENMMNIECFSLLILIENLVVACSILYDARGHNSDLAKGPRLRHRQSTSSVYLLLSFNIIFDYF